MISGVYKFAKLSLACVCGLLLSGCEMDTTGLGGPGINPNKPVEVALLVPSGSSDAGVNALANSLIRSAQMAVEENAQTPIDLKIYSTAGNPEQAANAAKQAVKDGAKIIIGPLYSESSNAVSVAVANSGVNVLSFSNNASVAGGRLFVMGNTYRNIADRLVGYASARGLVRIASVAPRNAAGNDAATEVSRAAARYGAQFTGSSSYDFNLNSIVQSAPIISQEVQAAGANAIVLTADSAGALPLLAQMLPENGLNPSEVKYMGLARWDIPPETLVQNGLQGGWFAVPDFNAAESFRARYVSKYGSDPHPLAGLAFDGIKTVSQMVQTGAANALTGQALVAAPGFYGASGFFRFMPDGTVQRALAVAEVDNGTYRIIDPAPRTFAGAGF